MRKRNKTPVYRCQHFTWVLFTRSGVFYADGRGNSPNLGKHSLGTRDRAEAAQQLVKLDAAKAVEFGLIPVNSIPDDDGKILGLGEGRALFVAYKSRPKLLGGVTPETVRSYQTYSESFQKYCGARSIQTWNAVHEGVLTDYGAWLDSKGIVPESIRNHLVHISSNFNWLVGEGHLPTRQLIKLKIKTGEAQPAYCWTLEEVDAILSYCREHQQLNFLCEVILTLAGTGMRISEALSLRWNDLELAKGMVALTDESGYRPQDYKRRKLKSGRSRKIPLSIELVQMFLEKQNQTAKRGRALVFVNTQGNACDARRLRDVFKKNVVTPLAEQFPSEDDSVKSFRDGRFHSFRHYFCSRCANSGVPESMLKKWLGHSTSQMVRRYYHLHDEESREQMSKLNLFTSSSRFGPRQK